MLVCPAVGVGMLTIKTERACDLCVRENGHFHHMIAKINKGQDIKSALLMSTFQFAYTTIFGLYSSHLFMQTNHLASCVAVHAFCNFMGFPDFVELLNLPPTKRTILSVVYVIGLVSFSLLLPSLTSADLYENSL